MLLTDQLRIITGNQVTRKEGKLPLTPLTSSPLLQAASQTNQLNQSTGQLNNPYSNTQKIKTTN